MPECLFFFISFCFPMTKNLFCQIVWQEFKAEMKLSGVSAQAPGTHSIH